MPMGSTASALSASALLVAALVFARNAGAAAATSPKRGKSNGTWWHAGLSVSSLVGAMLLAPSPKSEDLEHGRATSIAAVVCMFGAAALWAASSGGSRKRVDSNGGATGSSPSAPRRIAVQQSRTPGAGSATVGSTSAGEGQFPWAPPLWLTGEEAARLIGTPPMLGRRTSGNLDGAASSSSQSQPTLEGPLKALRQAMKEENLLAVELPAGKQPLQQERQVHEPIDDHALCKFLLAAKFDERKAVETLRKYILWRKEVPGSLKPPQEWLDLAAAIVPFEDKNGRPVVFIRMQHMLPDQLPIELIEQGYCATLDAIMGHTLAKRAAGTSSSKNPLEQYCAVIDVSDTKRANFSLAVVKMMQRVATNRYCERVGTMYVLSPSRIVQFLWNGVKPLLLERTQNNIKMIPTAEVHSTMRDLMGDRVQELPQEYGGSAPNFPTPGQARSLEDKAGVLAASAWRSLGTNPDWDKGTASSAGSAQRQGVAAVAAGATGPRSGGGLQTPSCSSCFSFLGF